MSFFKFLILCYSGTDSTETSLVATVDGGYKDVCAPNPCHNGCECQASCRDEDSYYCHVPDNAPFVGKNCDWEMEVNCVSGAFVIAVPEGFMHELEQEVTTGYIQFCGNGDYFCSPDERCMFNKVEFGSFYIFDMELKPDCPWIMVNHDTDGGGFFTSGTIVWDRLNDMGIHMPRPMKRVTCTIDILPVSAEIKPTPGSGTSITEPGPPNVNMTFWKTAYGVEPSIPATLGVIHKRVTYIISEVIHVRIQPTHLSLPHVINKLEPHDLTHEGVTFHLQTCWFQRANSNDKRKYVFIENDHVVTNPMIPVWIEHVPAVYRPVLTDEDRRKNNKEALAFSFQVALFRNGDQMEINCNTRIEFGYHQWFDLTNRRKRDLEPELVEYFDLMVNQSFVTYKPANKTVLTSEDGIQSNIQLDSSWNNTKNGENKNERFTHFLADRFYTTLFGVGFIFLATTMFYVSWVYWFRQTPMGIQLRPSIRYSFSSPSVIDVNSTPTKL